MDEQFAGYVRARGEHLLRVAVLLTGDWHAAEDLVQASLVKLYRSWPRLDTKRGSGRLPAADHGEHASVLVAGAVAARDADGDADALGAGEPVSVSAPPASEVYFRPPAG